MRRMTAQVETKAARVVVLGAIAALTLAAVACDAIIGTRDITLVPADAAVTGDGALPDGEIVLPDGATVLPDGSSFLPDGGGGGFDGGCQNASLDSDPVNCGRCGHSCLGGGCEAGVCQPFTLVSGQPGATGIAVDDTGLYWAASGSGQVVHASADGGGATVLATDPGGASFALTIDDANVYWTVNNDNSDPTNPGRVERCAKAGCARLPTTLVTNVREPYSVAVDGANLYWAEWDNGAVGRATKADGGAPGYIVTQKPFMNSVVVAGPTLYYASGDSVGAVATNAPSVPAHTDTATGTTITIQPTTGMSGYDPYGLALDTMNLYWGNNDNLTGAVFFASKASTGSPPATALAPTEPNVVQVAVDATNVYWVAMGVDDASGNYPNGYVATCPKSGCPASGPTHLANHLSHARGIAVDATAVYIAIHGDAAGEGSIVKVAK
jgi:hypothetical protein